MTTKSNAERAIYTPSEASALTVSLVENSAQVASNGVPFYLGSLDEYWRPIRPTNFVTVIGRPSNFKSGLMQYIARKRAEWLKDNGVNDRCVIYVTWEQAIEEMTLLELSALSGNDANEMLDGNVRDKRAFMEAAMVRGTIPLWLVGHSIERRDHRPRLKLGEVNEALIYAEKEWGMKPDLIVLDYLQRMGVSGGYDERTQRSANVDLATDMGFNFGCPVIMGGQARREVDSRIVKLPGMADAEGTANVEHSSDIMLSTWMPKVTEPINTPLPDGLTVYGSGGRVLSGLRVTEDMLLVHTAKRKFGSAGRIFAFSVQPGINDIRPYNHRSAEAGVYL